MKVTDSAVYAVLNSYYIIQSTRLKGLKPSTLRALYYMYTSEAWLPARQIKGIYAVTMSDIIALVNLDFLIKKRRGRYMYYRVTQAGTRIINNLTNGITDMQTADSLNTAAAIARAPVGTKAIIYPKNRKRKQKLNIPKPPAPRSAAFAGRRFKALLK